MKYLAIIILVVYSYINNVGEYIMNICAVVKFPEFADEQGEIVWANNATGEENIDELGAKYPDMVFYFTDN